MLGGWTSVLCCDRTFGKVVTCGDLEGRPHDYVLIKEVIAERNARNVLLLEMALFGKAIQEEMSSGNHWPFCKQEIKGNRESRNPGSCMAIEGNGF